MSEAPGASTAAGQARSAAPAGASGRSTTCRPVRLTLPVLVAVTVTATVWPARDTRSGVTERVRVRAGAALVLTVAREAAEVTVVPPGAVARAVALLSTLPWSRSAWVTA